MNWRIKEWKLEEVDERKNLWRWVFGQTTILRVTIGTLSFAAPIMSKNSEVLVFSLLYGAISVTAGATIEMNFCYVYYILGVTTRDINIRLLTFFERLLPLSCPKKQESM